MLGCALFRGGGLGPSTEAQPWVCLDPWWWLLFDYFTHRFTSRFHLRLRSTLTLYPLLGHLQVRIVLLDDRVGLQDVLAFILIHFLR